MYMLRSEFRPLTMDGERSFYSSPNKLNNINIVIDSSNVYPSKYIISYSPN